MPEGSPVWQVILFFVAVVIIVWQAARGWRIGTIRSGVNVAAIVLSTLAGLLAAQLAAASQGGFGDISGLLAGLCVGLGVGFAVLFAIWIAGLIVFRRQAAGGSAALSWLSRLGGAWLGALLGILIVWGGISVIRAMGALAEAKVANARAAAAISPSIRPPAIANGIATLKQSLEMGPAGQIVERVDVLPPDFYQLVQDLGRITSDPNAMLRFLQFPGVQEVIKSPRIASLLNDPQVLKAAESRDFLGLMQNKNLLEALDDPTLSDQIKKIDLLAAIKFALEKPGPSPAPSPATQTTEDLPAAPAR